MQRNQTAGLRRLNRLVRVLRLALVEWASLPPAPTGSNAIAIAGGNRASGKALLLINSHTSF